MKLTLRICFEVSGFNEFNIENAPYVPVPDSSFNCIWDDFIDDENQLKKLKEFDKNNVWNVDRVLSSDFSKDEAVCWIVLDAHHPLNDEERTKYSHR